MVYFESLAVASFAVFTQNHIASQLVSVF